MCFQKLEEDDSRLDLCMDYFTFVSEGMLVELILVFGRLSRISNFLFSKAYYLISLITLTFTLR